MSDPTFEETARRLSFGVGDWTIKGPYNDDGSQPLIHVDHRLGVLIIKTLLLFSTETVSRRERERITKGEPRKSIRLVKSITKKKTPEAVEFGDESSNEGSTENTPTERGIFNV
ncbi:hypothetical protein ACR5KS_03020 [Leucobacter sp. W1153]|uniref:hypothetical protein n=1 Tax=Leucobacter sp. W1153 TaxID=3439064 RepID=UPI003F3C2A90